MRDLLTSDWSHDMFGCGVGLQLRYPVCKVSVEIFLTSEKVRTLRVNRCSQAEIKAAETQIYAQSSQF